MGSEVVVCAVVFFFLVILFVVWGVNTRKTRKFCQNGATAAPCGLTEGSLCCSKTSTYKSGGFNGAWQTVYCDFNKNLYCDMNGICQKRGESNNWCTNSGACNTPGEVCNQMNTETVTCQGINTNKPNCIAKTDSTGQRMCIWSDRNNVCEGRYPTGKCVQCGLIGGPCCSGTSTCNDPGNKCIYQNDSYVCASS